MSCNVQLQSPEARLRAPINGLVRVDGVDDVPPWPQAVENAAPRAVRIRLAWDSLTAARPLHTSSIARPSGVGLEDISTSARSLQKRSLSFDPDEATLHSPRHEPAGGTPGLQTTSRSTAASTGVPGLGTHIAAPVPAPFFTVDHPKGPRGLV